MPLVGVTEGTSAPGPWPAAGAEDSPQGPEEGPGRGWTRQKFVFVSVSKSGKGTHPVTAALYV